MAATIAANDCLGTVLDIGQQKRAVLTTCSGWQLSKYPAVKQWMVEDVRKYDYKQLSISKNGSEPVMQIFEVKHK